MEDGRSRELEEKVEMEVEQTEKTVVPLVVLLRV